MNGLPTLTGLRGNARQARLVGPYTESMDRDESTSSLGSFLLSITFIFANHLLVGQR